MTQNSSNTSDSIPDDRSHAGEPPIPQLTGGPSKDWPHYALYEKVLSAIRTLPHHFSTTLNIEGLPATDLFTLNTALGASIEQSMVNCLNDLRGLWDPQGAYPLYKFVRQPQTFPDVRLQTDDPEVADRVLMGIELKGWFVLAKEGEPSFRYNVTPAACAPQDLLVVVPWSFNNVISGAPILLEPIIVEARFAAEMRNHHWRTRRGASLGPAEREIKPAPHQTPYPDKADQSSDEAVQDSGDNFGRIARSRILDQQIKATLQYPASGIPLFAWLRFLRIFTEKTTAGSVHSKLDGLSDFFAERYTLSPGQLEALEQGFTSIAKAFNMRSSPDLPRKKRP